MVPNHLVQSKSACLHPIINVCDACREMGDCGGSVVGRRSNADFAVITHPRMYMCAV